MQLSTFGAILKFAIDQENDLAGIVRALGSQEGASPLRALTDRIISDCEKAGKLLERTRRQGINEVVLHAVTGIDSDNYRIEALSARGLPAGGLPAHGMPAHSLPAREIGEYLAATLETIAAFYSDAAPKITNPEAARIFKRLGTERLALRDDIKAHLFTLGEQPETGA